LSRHFTRQEFPNLLFTLNPAIQQLNFFTNDVNGSYNALLTQIENRFSNSFAIDAQYTFSRAQDNASSDFAMGTFPFQARSEWALSDFDMKHNLKLYGMWTPRILRGSHAWVDKIVGGWTVTGILNAHTGFPWTRCTTCRLPMRADLALAA